MNVRFNQFGYAGRLGNQLWQAAATIGIAAKRGDTAVLDEKWAYRKWFSIPDSFFGPATETGIDSYNTVEAQHLDSKARIYLQDYSFFGHMADKVREYFAWSPEAWKLIDVAKSCVAHDPVAIHVRGGDYATNPTGTLNTLPMSYYVAAMYQAKLAGKEDFVIFTDDFEGTRTRFAQVGDATPILSGPSSDPKHGSEGPGDHSANDFIDMAMMSLCSRHIISNSTYSWWAAFLSGDPCVFYPSQWFGEQLAHHDASLMIPPGWVSVPCS